MTTVSGSQLRRRRAVQVEVAQQGGSRFGKLAALGDCHDILADQPREQVVAVVWSAWRQAWQTDTEFETYALLAAAVDALRN